MNPKSAQTLTNKGIECNEFSAKKVNKKLLRESFAIVCMTEKQKEILMELRWKALREAGEEEIENNVYSFAELTGYEILDPYGRDEDCYRYVFGLLSTGMPAVVEKLGLRTLSKPAPKKRGRPKKNTEIKDFTPKKRGRPKKTSQNVQLEIKI